jgi:uncharacterized protein YjbI with pentapeptide repeats
MSLTVDNNSIDCQNRLKGAIIDALSQTIQSYNRLTYRASGNLMRQAIEALCIAILFDRLGNNYQSVLNNTIIIMNNGRPKDRSLHELIGHIRDTNNLKFDTNRSENSKIGSILLNIKSIGNDGSHSNYELNEYSEIEIALVNFKTIIKWYYGNNIPNDIVTLLNGQLPKTEDRNRLEALANYLTYLRSLFDKGIMGHENLPLSTMYIQPKIEFWKKSLKNPLDTASNKPYSRCEAYPMLSTFIDNFLNNSPANTYSDTFQRPKARMLLLFGQPGQGKTSFCHWLLNKQIPNSTTTPLNPAELFGNGKGIVYLRLRNIDNAQELFTNPFGVIYNQVNNDICPDNEYIRLDNEYISKKGLAKSLIVLDGLDELAMQGNVSKDILEGFCKDLIRILEIRPEMRIVLTSRHSYADLEKFNEGNKLIIAQIGLLDKSQQLDWLRLYKSKTSDCKLSEEQLQLINNEEEPVQSKYRHLQELVTQPILLQMVALVGLDTKEANRSTIYKKLFDTLVARTWADQQIGQLDGLRSETLRDVMREIAFAIHKSEHEYIRAGEMEKLESVQDFRESVGADSEENIYKRLMIAFYLQEIIKKGADKKPRTAVEFMHKSLQEYLTAEYIWAQLKELSNKDEYDEYIINDKKGILDLFWRLFSHKELSREIESYLEELIAADANDSIKNIVFERLMQNAADMLKREFLPEHQIKNLRQPLYLFRSYWHILACLCPEECIVKDNFKQKFVYMIKMEQTVSYRKWHLPKAEFSDTNLSKMFLIYAELQQANLRDANLQGADFGGADLQGANLQGADLQGAKLQSAKLQHAKLQLAELQGANLQGANLLSVNLRAAILHSANLQKANLHRAYLEGAYLQGADLKGADLKGADLKEAYLLETNLLGVKNLTLAQICEAETLYLAKIDEPLLQQIKDSEFTYLLEDPDEKLDDDDDDENEDYLKF